MILQALAAYGLIGLLVGVAVLMVHGDRLMMGFDILASHSGIDIGPVGMLMLFTLVSVVAWPFMLNDLRN